MNAGVASAVVVLTTHELVSGYRLAGVRALAFPSGAEAARAIAAILDARAAAVLAVHEPFLTSLEPALRRRVDEALPPLVVTLPDGLESEEGSRRERLLQALWQAVGYEITFDGEAPRPSR